MPRLLTDHGLTPEDILRRDDVRKKMAALYFTPAPSSPEALTDDPTGWELTSGTIGDVYATTDVVPSSFTAITR